MSDNVKGKEPVSFVSVGLSNFLRIHPVQKSALYAFF